MTARKARPPGQPPRFPRRHPLSAASFPSPHDPPAPRRAGVDHTKMHVPAMAALQAFLLPSTRLGGFPRRACRRRPCRPPPGPPQTIPHMLRYRPHATRPPSPTPPPHRAYLTCRGIAFPSSTDRHAAHQRVRRRLARAPPRPPPLHAIPHVLRCVPGVIERPSSLEAGRVSVDNTSGAEVSRRDPTYGKGMTRWPCPRI